VEPDTKNSIVAVVRQVTSVIVPIRQNVGRQLRRLTIIDDSVLSTRSKKDELLDDIIEVRSFQHFCFTYVRTHLVLKCV
jgi:hypothetical protein